MFRRFITNQRMQQAMSPYPKRSVHRSPSKISQQKQKQKCKRESEKFGKMLATKKQNLSKVENRILPAPRAQPPTLFDQIHVPILNGEAKKKLKPVVIIIDD